MLLRPRQDETTRHGTHLAVLKRLHRFVSGGRGTLGEVVRDGSAAVESLSLALGDAARRIQGTTQPAQRGYVGAPHFAPRPIELGVDAHEVPHLVDVGGRRPAGPAGCADAVQAAFAPRPGIVDVGQSTRARSPLPPTSDGLEGAEANAEPDHGEDRPEHLGAVTRTGGMSVRPGRLVRRVGDRRRRDG